MNRKNKKHLTSAILLAAFIALLLMQMVRANPISVSISPTSGPVGTSVVVSGVADTLGGTVNIYFDIDGDAQTDPEDFQTSTTASVTSPYSYEAAIVVPPSIAGTHAITATDVSAGTSTGAYFTVTSSITTSPASGPIGEMITVAGTGFDRISVVMIEFDDIDVTPSPVPETNDVGSFTTSFPAPPSIAGDHIVTATDAADNTYSTTFTVLGTTISITPNSGPVGTIVAVSGTYATPSGSVAIMWDDVEVDTVTAEGDGIYSYDLMVPPSVAGAHTVTAEDVASTNNASETFTLLGITLSIDRTSGVVDTVVSVTGTYATPEGSILIRWDGTEMETITAELDGTYSYDLIVPASVTGDHTITVEDVESTNTATQTFTVEPKIVLTPEDGLVGDSVTVTGTGFSGVSQVDVYFDIDKDGLPDTEELMLDDVPTDEFGSLEASFNVPWVSTAGNYPITAVDNEGETDDATFTVLFVMYTRSDEYFQGDYPSFFIDVADVNGAPVEGVEVVVKIFDPAGFLQYKGITFTTDDGTVPYDLQFFNWWVWNSAETFEFCPLHLPSDALVGTWSWTATADGLPVSASFEVVEPVDLRTLLDKLDQLLEGQTDIADLISYYGIELQLEHGELAELIVAVSNNLQMDLDELVTLIHNVADKLQLEHEVVIGLIGDVASNLNIGLDALSGLISSVSDELQMDHSELAALITEVSGKLDLTLEDIAQLIGAVTNNQEELVGLMVALELKLDLTTSELAELVTALADNHEELVGLVDALAADMSLSDIAELISQISDKIQMEHEGLAAIISGVADTLQLQHEALIELVGSIADKLQIEHEYLATLITDVFDALGIKLDDISAQITGIEEKADGLYVVIGELEVKLDDIQMKLTAIQGDIATINTSLGQIQVDLEDINAEIVEIKDSIVTIQTDVGAIQVELDDVQAKLVDIQDDLAVITTTLGEIETKVDNLGAVSLEEIKGDIATIKSDIGTIKVNVNNINANITNIKGRLVTIETTVGTIQEDIDSINGKIAALEGDTATIQTDIGTVKTSLSDINAKIKVTNDNVATIETDIGTVKGRLTSVEDCMSIIQTDIGTVKTTTSSIETTGESVKSDTSMQPITVGLSLIAAIGAIAAAVMVLRKVYMK